VKTVLTAQHEKKEGLYHNRWVSHGEIKSNFQFKIENPGKELLEAVNKGYFETKPGKYRFSSKFYITTAIYAFK
jgi:hypothetical protein